MILPCMKCHKTSQKRHKNFPDTKYQRILPKTKLKFLEKSLYEKLQVVSNIYKSFQYNFWQNYLEFSNQSMSNYPNDNN